MPETKDYTLDIVSLRITTDFISKRRKPDQLSTADLSFVSRSLNAYFKYQEVANNASLDPNINDIGSLLSSTNTVTLDNIANFLEKLSNQTDQPEKTSKQKAESDQNNIPAELESMVALYKQHQADLLDSEREHTVSDTIKNIRKDWLEREKHRLIYENASKERQKQIDEEREKFFNQSVDPKKSYAENTRNIQAVAENLLIAEGISNRLSRGDYQKAVNLISHSIQAGGVNVDNKNDLFSLTQIVRRDFLGEETIIDKVDDLVQEEIRQNEINGYDDSDQSYDTQLTYAEQDIATRYTLQAKQFVSNIDKIKDFDTYQDAAKAEADRILKGLDKAIPNPRTLYNDASLEIDRHREELEKAIYEDTLAINKKYQLEGSTQRIQLRPSSVDIQIKNKDGTPRVDIPARLSGALSQTGGGVSSTIVDLYSRGLTPQKLDKILSLPGSKTYELLSKNKTIQKRVQLQLQKLHDSELGKGISKGLEKLKPLSDSYYRLSGTAQKILDPIGTGKDYLNKKIGQYVGRQIIKNTSSAAAQKFGKYILENGLKEGAKKFADAAAKKLLIEGAKAIGVQTAKVAGMAAADSAVAALAVALGIPTAGASLLIAAALVVVQITWEIGKSAFKKIYEAVWDEEFDTKKALGRGILVGASFLTAGVIIKNSWRGFSVATKAALISAAGIIWLSLATIAVFLTLTFMVAPLLSTFVQLDSEEKVQYLEPIVNPDAQTADCGSGSVSNDKAVCRGNYCFPVADKEKASFKYYHHEYPAQDIMRIGDKPGNQDDVPLAIVAYTSGTIVNINDETGGLSVWLAGDDGRFYWFTHLSKTTTSGGIKVKAGDIIGCMGTSGNAEGYLQHLHFHISTKPNMSTVPENYPNFIWPYQDFCQKGVHCGELNPEQYPELPYL